MDELLSQIKKEYEEKDKQNNSTSSSSHKHDKNLATKGKQFSGMDKLLAEVKSEFEDRKDILNNTPQTNFDSLLSKVKSDLDKGDFLQSNDLSSTSQKSISESENKVLNEIKREIRKQEQEEQLRQEKLNQQKLKEIKEQAKLWLENLDSHSEEGLWFEEFAYSYSSKFAAAIDYLAALEK